MDRKRERVSLNHKQRWAAKVINEAGYGCFKAIHQTVIEKRERWRITPSACFYCWRSEIADSEREPIQEPGKPTRVHLPKWAVDDFYQAEYLGIVACAPPWHRTYLHRGQRYKRATEKCDYCAKESRPKAETLMSPKALRELEVPEPMPPSGDNDTALEALSRLEDERPELAAMLYDHHLEGLSLRAIADKYGYRSADTARRRIEEGKEWLARAIEGGEQ